MGTLDDLVESLSAASTSAAAFGPDVAQALVAAVLAAGGDWLDPQYLQRDPDAAWALHPVLRGDRCSVLVAVFAPGVTVPVHDHGTWAVVGMYRGRERETRYRPIPAGPPAELGTRVNTAGDVTVVPTDLAHTIEALDGVDAASIHVYGCDIVTRDRHEYDLVTGETRRYQPFPGR